MKDLLSYLKRHRPRFLDELCDYLRIPSVSTRSEHAGDVERAAVFTADQLRQAGLVGVELHATRGHPIVTGSTPQVVGRPTVLVYGHYDVQPAEPLDLWKSPPFAPEVRGNRLFARGAADDKGQVFVYMKVLEAFHRVRGAAPVNVKVLIEGEEEIGSPNLVPFVERNAKRLSCDAALVSDTHMLGPGTPSITTGLRGIICLEVTVRTIARDLHSGNYGGTVANPIQVLAELLVACKDPRSGKVKIPGFYADVRPLTRRQRLDMAALPHDDARFARAIGALKVFGEKGFSTAARVGARPTFEVNGIWGGYTGEGMKTVLPSVAHTKVSMRLVADQNPLKVIAAFKRYLKDIAPAHARVSARKLENVGSPILADPEAPAMRVAADAVHKVFGKPPLLAMEGGSVPIVAELQRVLRCDPVLLGFGLPDDNLHAPNEKFDLRMFDRGMKTVAHFLEDFALQAEG